MRPVDLILQNFTDSLAIYSVGNTFKIGRAPIELAQDYNPDQVRLNSLAQLFHFLENDPSFYHTILRATGIHNNLNPRTLQYRLASDTTLTDIEVTNAPHAIRYLTELLTASNQSDKLLATSLLSLCHEYSQINLDEQQKSILAGSLAAIHKTFPERADSVTVEEYQKQALTVVRYTSMAIRLLFGPKSDPARREWESSLTEKVCST